MLYLDGSTLEGGGQLIRNAVALSALTSQPINITKIRANRDGRQGLKASHTAALKFLADICGAHMVGTFVGSSELSFFPRQESAPSDGQGVETVSVPNPSSKGPSLPIKTKYDISLPTPGSVFLVFQALYPYLLYAGASVAAEGQAESESPAPIISLSISGGTNVSFSPSYDYISQVLIPNFAKLGLPALSVKLHDRGWSTGKTEFGAVTFKIDPLSCIDVLESEKEAVDGTEPITQTPRAKYATPGSCPKFPFFRLNDFERGTITQIDITILAPDDLVSHSAPTRKANKKKGKGYNAHPPTESSSTNPSQTVRELFESETVLSLEHAFQSNSDVTDMPTINIQTSERTHHRSRIYLLLVAHTSTGFRLGRDVGPGLSSRNRNSQDHQSSQRGGKKQGNDKKGHHARDDEDEEENSMEYAIRRTVDRCVRGLVSEISGRPDSDEQGKRGNGHASAGKENLNGGRKCCLDKYMRDQVVVFEALGKVFANTDREQDGTFNQVENEEGLTLHSKTAMWVCEQMLGV